MPLPPGPLIRARASRGDVLSQRPLVTQPTLGAVRLFIARPAPPVKTPQCCHSGQHHPPTGRPPSQTPSERTQCAPQATGLGGHVSAGRAPRRQTNHALPLPPPRHIVFGAVTSLQQQIFHARQHLHHTRSSILSPLTPLSAATRIRALTRRLAAARCTGPQLYGRPLSHWNTVYHTVSALRSAKRPPTCRPYGT